MVEYGFMAIAGSEELSETQSNVTDWLKQDRLEGFGYIKKWNRVFYEHLKAAKPYLF